MWDKFQALTQTSDWENGGGFVIERVAKLDDLDSHQGLARDLTLDLHVAPDGGAQRQRWRLCCAGVRDQFIRFEWCDDLKLLDQHVLLWPYQRDVLKMWFAGRADNVPALVGDLYLAHKDLCGGWFEFEKFLRLHAQHLASGSGLLAEGPQNVLEIYAQVLAAHGMKSSFTGWRQQSVQPLRLVLFGRSYVICKEAEIELIASEEAT